MAFADYAFIPNVDDGPELAPSALERAKALFRIRIAVDRESTDRLFYQVLVVQWVIAAAVAWGVSPVAWGEPLESDAGFWRLKLAMIVGAALTLSAVAGLLLRGHNWATRCWLAVAQIGWSLLLIELTAGRPGVHLHLFASLALLSRYRDWRVLTFAFGAAFLGTLSMGLARPQGFFGITYVDPIRVIELEFWLIAASAFFMTLIRGRLRELWRHCLHEVDLERQQQVTEEQVRQRTEQLTEHALRLEEAQEQLRRQTEKLKAQATELDAARIRAEQSAIAKSMFLTNMSHEIRTPMTAILGYSEILQDQLSHAPDPESGELIGSIRRNGEHLLQIINDILDLSHIEAGKFNVERVPFSVAEIVEEVASPLYARAQSKGLSLKTEVDPQAPPIVLGDPARLRQVLINLVSNSIKFTEEGHICLKVALAENESGAARLKFIVIDTGIGLANDKATDLFQPFTQADFTTTRKYGGTGLGLAITKRLTELMGGLIEVDGTPGAGSVFIVELPLVLPGRKSERKTAPAYQAAPENGSTAPSVVGV